MRLLALLRRLPRPVRISPNSQRGAAMIEAVAAIAVTATAGAATLALISVSSASTASGATESTASWLASSQAEKIHASDFVTTPGQYTAVNAPTDYTVTNTTSDVEGGDPGIQMVTVTVSYQGKDIVSVEFVKVNR